MCECVCVYVCMYVCVCSFGAALAGGAIAGPMGAFTALPIAALITSFMKNYLADREVAYQSDQIQRSEEVDEQPGIDAPASPDGEL